MKPCVLVLALSLIPAFSFAVGDLDPIREEISVSRPIQSPLNFALDLKYVPIHYRNLTPASGHGGQIALEWLPIGNRFGKPVLGVSAGGGHIKRVPLDDGSNAQLTTIPVTAYLGYRLDFIDNQILVPFGKVGRNVTWIKQRPGSDSRYDAWDYSLGVELCLNGIDSRSARRLDASTGINGTFLVFEWIKSIPNRGNTQPNLAREEVQMGLRFEM